MTQAFKCDDCGKYMEEKFDTVSHHFNVDKDGENGSFEVAVLFDMTVTKQGFSPFGNIISQCFPVIAITSNLSPVISV